MKNPQLLKVSNKHFINYERPIINMGTQKSLNELGEIKTRLINLELLLIKSEKASKRDIRRVKMALNEYKEGKTIPLSKLSL
jgi:hypothetical protein